MSTRADAPASAPPEDGGSRATEQLLEALTAYGATYAQVGREFATTAGLHTTDATALVEILGAEERGTPLTPARLSERIGLSFGATSTLLNRLEAAHHVERSRGHADRRLVTLHSTPTVHEVAERFFDPLGERVTAVLAPYSDEEVARLARMLAEVRQAMETYATEADDARTTTQG
ncbi:transcriptional regulator [Sanguibacter keddieii DSM 10542]|uniref:Transcriptional regulator n=1 Tax=Sanguibacter keddieii (strain ATCC 51767 / DSM 10542 / NCFB 3025 / ST-74) TaxID=446469 RepID=D1BDH9_SANKS|nr:MarR family transcriptional regulator [Sanguibacter keddieii]ACZ21041.1 transcriptional regulator [Sanguibacter keddieii DSM 10542]